MPRDPSDYPRRLLLGVIGLTPQVVTETLYALIRLRRPPFKPTGLHLISTQQGAERIALQLLDPDNGALHRFASDYAPDLAAVFRSAQIEVLSARSGVALDDIRSAEDGMRAADAILGAVRTATNDQESAVCASIAGGRKTMGFLLGYALSLYGRAQDRLTHVLVDAPFQDHPEFFYPPPKPRVLFVAPGNRPVRTDSARIVLTDIPFVRLRQGMPARLLSGDSSFADTIAEAQEALAPPALVIDIASRSLFACGRAIALPPAEFAFVAWFAQRRLSGKSDGGALAWRSARLDEFLSIYRALPGLAAGASERVARPLSGGMERSWFEQRKARVNKLVTDALGARGGPYMIHGSGRRPHTVYGLSPGLRDIVIRWPTGEGEKHGAG